MFGGRYWDERRAEYDPDLYVSPYACQSPAEDFADTVMVYTRHRGRVDRYRHRPGVMNGFEFVAELTRQLERSGLAIT